MLKQVKPGLFAMHWNDGEKMTNIEASDYFRFCQYAFELI